MVNSKVNFSYSIVEQLIPDLFILNSLFILAAHKNLFILISYLCEYLSLKMAFHLITDVFELMHIFFLISHFMMDL